MVGCAAHARRKFDEALTALPKEQQQTFRAAEALCYFAKLFQLEQSFAELKPEERYTKRLEQAKPVLDALLAWANDLIPRTAPKSALGKALHYLKEQWPYLVRYLEDGRLYWRPAEIASKGPARKANCGAKEKAITEFFQILYTEQ